MCFKNKAGFNKRNIEIIEKRQISDGLLFQRNGLVESTFLPKEFNLCKVLLEYFLKHFNFFVLVPGNSDTLNQNGFVFKIQIFC